MIIITGNMLAAWTLTAISQSVTDSNINNSLTFPNSRIYESGSITVIDAVGDIECSTKLHDRIKMDNPTVFVALGDLCYKRDLTNFTLTYSDFKKENK